MVNWDLIGSEGNAKKQRGVQDGEGMEKWGDSSRRNKMDGSGLKGGGTGGRRMVEDSSGHDKGHTGEGEGEDGAKAKKGSTGGQSMETVGNFMPVQSLIADGYQKVDRWDQSVPSPSELCMGI
jgi:hypothetical protein